MKPLSLLRNLILTLAFSSVSGLTTAAEILDHVEFGKYLGLNTVFAEVGEVEVKVDDDSYRMDLEKQRQEAIEAMPSELRTFLYYYPVAVFSTIFGLFIILIHGYMRFLHPSWSWGSQEFWRFLLIVYLGVFSSYICAAFFNDPTRLTDAWLGGGLFYLPIAISKGWFKETPEEKIQRAIRTMPSNMDDPSVSIFSEFLLWLFKVGILCAIGGIVLHLEFWCRSLVFFFRACSRNAG